MFNIGIGSPIQDDTLAKSVVTLRFQRNKFTLKSISAPLRTAFT
jgi:hypothetical protein